MACDGIFQLNPVCLATGAAEAGSGVAGNMAQGAFGSIASSFGSAANSATTWLWKELNDATTLDLSSPRLLREMAVTGAIAGVLCLGLFVIQVMSAAVRGRPVALVRAFSGLLVSFVGSAFALAMTRLLLGAVDSLSDGVVQYTLGTDINGLGGALTFGNIAAMQNPAIIILFALVILAAVVVVWAAMMIRKLMLVVAAVLAPLAFAGATADITRGWVRRWIELVAAMIASKLLLVIVLSMGVAVINGAGQAGSGPAQQTTQLAGGALILLLGGFAPWMAIRMFHFAGDSIHAAHAAAGQSAAGAQAAIAAPQKVAALQGSARAITGGFGGNRGVRGGGSWGSGGLPPAPPRPAIAGTPTGSPIGGGIGAGTSKQVGTAASSGGAAAATSAAVPAIGAAAAGASALKGVTNKVGEATSVAAPTNTPTPAAGAAAAGQPSKQPPPPNRPGSPS